jgi:hypothetical protein
MSWLYSQALVAEYLAENSLDGEQSAPSNGNPIPLAFLPPDKMTAFSRLSRSGMTFAPLTDDLGEDVLTWFLAGFPARTSVAPEKAQESTENDLECGWKWPESFAKWHPATSSWKTRQCSLLEGLDEFSETWPKWGSMQDGECFPLGRLGLTTYASVCGLLLPTIGKNEYRGTSKSRFHQSPEFRGAKMGEGVRTSSDDPIYLSPSFSEEQMMWPIMWTALAPLETDKFQQWLHSHSNF